MGRYDLSPVFGSAAGVFMSLSAWCTVYLILGASNPNRRAEWHCRVTTVIHAVLVCSLSVYAACIQGPWPFTDPGGLNTPFQRFTVIVCLGYFLFDFAWCLVFKTEGPMMLTHHALTILGLTVTLFRGCYGTEMMASIFGTEISNPLLQMRWFLRETGRKGTRWAVINDVLFISTFGAFRIGVGSYLLYTYFHHPRPDWLGKFGGFTLYMIGFVFWIQICAYGYRKLFRPKRKRLTSENGVASVQNGSSSGENSNKDIDHLNNVVREAKPLKSD